MEVLLWVMGVVIIYIFDKMSYGIKWGGLAGCFHKPLGGGLGGIRQRVDFGGLDTARSGLARLTFVAAARCRVQACGTTPFPLPVCLAPIRVLGATLSGSLVNR